MDQASSRLLVIGDDPQWLQSITTILASAGYEVSNALAGSEALDQAMEQAPDLLLLGTPSSGADNFQGTRRLKDDALQPFCLLLLFDANPTPPDLARALEAGADDWLVWPASEHQLLSRVQTTLRLHHATLALKKSEERFKAQYKGLPIPVYTWQKADDDFVLVDFNHAAHQITRGNVTQLLGARASQLYGGEPGIVHEMWHCYTEQHSFRREMLYHYRSIDDTRHLSVSYGFVPPDTVLVHTQDVTERVQAMDDLQQLRDELEQRVRRRTVELDRANRSLRAEVDERRLVEHALRESEQRYRLLAENATDMISRHTPEGVYLYASPMARPLLGYEPRELVGRSAYDFFHPDDLAGIRQSHQTILEQPIIYSISYRMRRKDGRYVWVETNSKTVRHPDTGQINEIVAITRDITDRKQVEDALRRSQQQLQSLYTRLEQHSRTLEEQVSARTREIEQRRQVAESLRDMLTILNSDLPLDEVLDYIVAGATRLLGSDTSAIYRLESPEEPLRIQTVQGSAAEAVGQVQFPPQFHQALRQGQPIAVTDVAVMPPDSPLALALDCVPDCFRGLLVVPLSAQGAFFGGLALYYARPRNLSDEEMGLAMAFAAQAALAIQNAQLRHQVREVAVMEERARLARELHDSVTQSLFSMNLLAEAGQRLAESGDVARLEAYLQRLGEMSHQSLKEMRLLVHELRPLALEKHGLLGALQRRLDAVEARAGVDARLLVEGTIQVPYPAEEHLYRIAEQALNNALKHAGARTLTVRLATRDGGLAMTIVDDGRGFDPEVAGDGAGQGLISMRERAAQIGGTLTVTSAPGQGTTIAVRLPSGTVPENHEVKR
jgi:PAS domain S-box-containing protein